MDIEHLTCDVAIIGGGIAGFSLALALQIAKNSRQKLTSVKEENNDDCSDEELSTSVPLFLLFERDLCFDQRRQGYGLTLQHANTLEALGILDEVRSVDCASNEHFTFSPDGRVLGYFGRDLDKEDHEPEYVRGNIRIPREDLRRILLERLPNTSVNYSMKLEQLLPRSDSQEGGVDLLFSRLDGSGQPNGKNVLVHAKVVVGADGIHSTVRRLMGGGGLSFLGVFLVIGISDTRDFFTDRRGFYTVDGRRRLFTMPFQAERESGSDTSSLQLDEHDTTKVKTLTMWQLSFAMENEAEARALSALPPEALLERCLLEVNGWHSPVEKILRSTALSGPHQIWSTPLYDHGIENSGIPRRDVSSLGKRHHETSSSSTSVISSSQRLLPSSSLSNVLPYVTLIGDAAHPMSPFKGQGANQALRDGPALASWLSKSLLSIIGPVTVETIESPNSSKQIEKRPRKPIAISSAISVFEREMAVRAGAKVTASREAARFFHSPAVLQETHKVSGVNDELSSKVLERAGKVGISAADGHMLVNRLRDCLKEVFMEAAALSLSQENLVSSMH